MVRLIHRLETAPAAPDLPAAGRPAQRGADRRRLLRHAAEVIREATAEDERVLRDLDRRVWSYRHSPVPFRDGPFELDGVLVSELADGIAGYVKVGGLWPIESVDHVLEVKGLAVDPRHQRQGVGRALINAAIEYARRA